jgi:type IV pilus assembly protein PilP
MAPWLAAGLATLALAGCSRDMGELNAYIEDVKARPPQPIEPIPPVRTYTPYVYEGEAARNPFVSSTSEGADAGAADVAAAADGPRPDFDRPKEYLERFELDTLEMVGTFANEEGYWGLVRDPDGVVHRVTIDNYIGKNHGRVIGIQEGAITLTELITDGAGGWLVREASIALEDT